MSILYCFRKPKRYKELSKYDLINHSLIKRSQSLARIESIYISYFFHSWIQHICQLKYIKNRTNIFAIVQTKVLYFYVIKFSLNYIIKFNFILARFEICTRFQIDARVLKAHGPIAKKNLILWNKTEAHTSKYKTRT